MNSKDVKTAKRLIAQFEDKAVGRYNSRMQMRRSELPQQVRARDEQDRRNGQMTIEEHEIECSFHVVITSLKRAIVNRASLGSLSAFDLVKKELEELKRLRVLIIRSKRTFSIAKLAIKEQMASRIEVVNPPEITFGPDCGLSTTVYDRTQIIDMLTKFENELTKCHPLP